MRLIDADEAVRAVHDEFDECLVWDESGATTANEFENIILQMPTVDAVEVVRCKDCKKYVPCQKLPIGTSKWCDLFDRATCEMNYCGWGERREDDNK